MQHLGSKIRRIVHILTFFVHKDSFMCKEQRCFRALKTASRRLPTKPEKIMNCEKSHDLTLFFTLRFSLFHFLFVSLRSLCYNMPMSYFPCLCREPSLTLCRPRWLRLCRWGAVSLCRLAAESSTQPLWFACMTSRLPAPRNPSLRC